MTKFQAIQDAKERTEKTGLTWLAIRIRLNRYLWGLHRHTYDSVSEHHKITHPDLYKSGKFKVIATFEPETDSEIDLGYLNIDRKTRRKLKKKLKNGTTSHKFNIPNSRDNANLNIPQEIKEKLTNKAQ